MTQNGSGVDCGVTVIGRGADSVDDVDVDDSGETNSNIDRSKFGPRMELKISSSQSIRYPLVVLLCWQKESRSDWRVAGEVGWK